MIARSWVWVAVFMILAGCNSGSPGDVAGERCGNGRVDLGEICDGADLADLRCEDFGLLGDGLACARNCTPDLAGCEGAVCGNDRVDGLGPIFRLCEQCDGDDLSGTSCAGLGGSGDLRCRGTCTVDREACDGICGNGRIDPGEDCDPGDPSLFTGQPVFASDGTCASLGLGAGSLSCSFSYSCFSGVDCGYSCELSTFGCERRPECGDGLAQGDEECDGADLRGRSCADHGLAGAAICGEFCFLDLSACAPSTEQAACGDGVVQTGEECDGFRIAPEVARFDFLDGCFAEARRRGILACDSSCRIDRAICEEFGDDFASCGNGVVDAEFSEECDGEDPRGNSCLALGGSGTARCDESCRLDLSDCDGVVGNGRRDPGEHCDGFDFGGLTCESLGYSAGNLLCVTFTSFPSGLRRTFVETGLCEGGQATARCGDGFATDGEACDGEDLAGASCALFDATGRLGCTAECDYDLSACASSARCGNGVAEFEEECDGQDLGAASCRADGGIGAYACGADCTIDRSLCMVTCEGGAEPFSVTDVSTSLANRRRSAGPVP